MEVELDEIQVRKFQRIGTNGRSSSSTTAHHNKIVPPPPCAAEDHHHAADQYHHHQNHHPDDEEDGLSVSLVKQRSSNGGGGGTGLDIIGAGARFGGWPSSRIIRVSRASGGKDRHSKVLTSKGLRDRRVRLSVTTAIQFYDLQDRLGYDQPSKAVEWLLQAAKSSISELPSLNPSFPDTPKSEENNNKRASENSEHGFDDSAPEHVELDGGDPHNNYVQQQQQGFSNSKSACSSTSETSKGSGGLSLSRSESRIRARERARERAAEKEKEKDNESQHGTDHQNVSPISQNNNSSFTELLTAGISSNNNNSNNSPNDGGGGGGGGDDSNLANKSRGQWSTTSPIPMEYLSAGLFGPRGGQTSSGFPGHTQLGINNTIPQFGDHHHHQNHLQHFSFVPENFSIPVATSAGAGGSSECAYNLNFSISSTTSGLAGYNRGTLQSNSSQSSSLLHPHYNIQRFPSIDGSNLPFFIGTSSAAAAAAADNQHHPQFPAAAAAAGFDARLQLCYGDSPAATARHSDHHKGKGK